MRRLTMSSSHLEEMDRRMPHGNIYPKDRVSEALTHFFKTDNLIALRELALRFLADETDEELLAHLRQRQAAGQWETSERIMVAVGTEPGTDVLVRRAARIAARVKGDLDVVHVVGEDVTSPRDEQRTGKLRELAATLGARWFEIPDDNPARAIASFAHEHRITQIVIGSSRRTWWEHLIGHGSNVRRVLNEAGAVGIDVHVIARRELPPAAAIKTGPPGQS